MPWARIDDRANSDAKLIALSDAAFRLWTCGLIFCQANLTDGFIPKDVIETFGVRARNKRALVRELTQGVLGKKALWQDTEGGWQVNDFLDWNDSREEVERKRAKGKDRVDRFRNRLNGHDAPKANGVRNALQTANERSLFAASTTTTTKPEDQEPRAGARRAPAQLKADLQSIADMRSHLRAACHSLIERGAPELQPDSPHFETEMAERLKGIAARHLRVCDYTGRDITQIIDAVVGVRSKRRLA